VKTPSTVRTLEDWNIVTVYPYASEKKEMRPLSNVNPLVEVSEVCKACDKAFALICHYSRGVILLRKWLLRIFGRLAVETSRSSLTWSRFRFSGMLKVFPFLASRGSLVREERRSPFWLMLKLGPEGLSAR